MEPDGVKTLSAPGKDLKICAFLWIYYGYPCSSYEGRSVEDVRNRCGELLAKRDTEKPDIVAGVPDTYAMKMGGWKTPTTLRKVYQSIFEDQYDKERDKVNNIFNSQFK
jgi:hypothetical protein